MLLHYLGKLKIHFLQIFGRYGRKCKQIACVHRFQFLYECNCACWVYLCVNRIFEIQRHGYFLFTAWSAAAWPRVNCACVPQLFRQLINTTLCPAFFRKNHLSVSTSLLCTPFKYKLFIKILSSSLNTMLIGYKHCSAVTSAVTNYRCHILIAKVNK